MIKPISILIPLQFSEELGWSAWVQTRQSSDKLNGLLEFPGGKIEGAESPEEAACRETLEEAKIAVEQEEILRFGQYQFPPLLIFVHLLEDKKQLFSKSGYYPLTKLISKKSQIPPNNLVFLEDLGKRLQLLRSLK